ncbi:MAG: methyltransferase domain-containing protein [Solirubrobacteraceae bacterium]
MRTAEYLSGLTALNIGSGARPYPGAVNLDITSDTDPDIVHDIREFPWPFPDNRFDEVHAIDVLEHVPDMVASMEEIHRICRPGARVHIVVPHFSSNNSYTDPTHAHHLSLMSFDYFTGEHLHSYYTRVRFRTVQRKLEFHRRPHDRILSRVASRHPEFYERRLAWILPAWLLRFELEVVESPPL